MKTLIGGTMDNVDKVTRSKIMKAIRSKSKIEDQVCSELWKHGIRFRRNTKSLYGNPDISIQKYKIVIFIDSCFWHYCPIHGHIPLSNLDYWEKKLYKNILRDLKVNHFYQGKNWNILRIWEHRIRNNFNYTIQEILFFIQSSKEIQAKKGDPS